MICALAGLFALELSFILYSTRPNDRPEINVPGGTNLGGMLRRSQRTGADLECADDAVGPGFAALGVDASALFVQKRVLQTASDAAALAAADELGPASDPTCQASMPCLTAIDIKVHAVAASYSHMNGGTDTLAKCVVSTDTNCYTWPYSHDFARVEIRLRKSASAFIAPAVGLKDKFDVAARAVARAKPTITQTPGNAIAIFAYAHNGTDPCNGTDSNGVPYGITIEGNPQDSIDAVLSNGSVTMNSKGTVGWAGYGPPPMNCAMAGSRQVNASTWAKQTSTIDWPRKFDRTAVCTGHDSNSAVSLNSPADGIYCSKVSITVTHLGGSHAVTFVAPIVNIPPGSGNNNFVLTPYNAGLDAANKDLVLWQYGSGQRFEMNGNNSAFNGVVWIQNGSLTYDGNSGVTGFYEAQNVWVPGNSYKMIGTGPAAGGTTEIVGATASLVEWLHHSVAAPKELHDVSKRARSDPASNQTRRADLRRHTGGVVDRSPVDSSRGCTRGAGRVASAGSEVERACATTLVL